MAQPSSRKLKITYLLRPHWKALSIALLAVIGEGVADILEPWPVKVVLDNVIGSKRMTPTWLAEWVERFFGQDHLAILNFTALAVILIAVIGAVSSYTEKYLTTSVGQWVTYDLRRTLYHHIQRLSLAYHDQKRSEERR